MTFYETTKIYIIFVFLQENEIVNFSKINSLVRVTKNIEPFSELNVCWIAIFPHKGSSQISEKEKRRLAWTNAWLEPTLSYMQSNLHHLYLYLNLNTPPQHSTLMKIWPCQKKFKWKNVECRNFWKTPQKLWTLI